MSEVVNSQEGKELQVSDEELAQLIEQNAGLQQQESKDDPIKADYICLAKDGTKALKRTNKDLYIEGLAMGDFFLQNDKKNLGPAIDVVPLAFITVYNEKTGNDRNATFCGIWNAEQAKQYPLVDGSYYDRQLPNGHILSISHWVMVEVVGHPEIENAVITFKSTGSRIYKSWKEDAKKRAKSSATLVYHLEEQVCKNDRYEWTDIGFNYAGSLLERDRALCVHCVKKSTAIRDSYKNNVLVPDRTVEKAVEALPEKSAYDEEETYDDEENGF